MLTDLLADPPPGLTVDHDIDGVTLRYRPPPRLGDHIMAWLSPLLMMVLPTLGIIAGVYPFAMLALSGGVGMLFVGMALSVVGLLAGFLLSLVPVYILSLGMERLLGVGSLARVHIRAHSIDLGTRALAIEGVLFVDRRALQVVLQGGERVPIAPGSPDAVRGWLAAVLHAVTASRPAASAADVPRALAALRSPPP